MPIWHCKHTIRTGEFDPNGCEHDLLRVSSRALGMALLTEEVAKHSSMAEVAGRASIAEAAGSSMARVAPSLLPQS
jgi:hypothetical protein